MRRPAALAIALTLAAAGCTKDEPVMPSACTDTRAAGYVAALRTAPGEVRLPGGTRISECLRRVRSDAELQNLGAVLFAVAEELGARAREQRDTAAARQLGYLAGAARAGAARSNGISSELSRRIDSAGRGIDESSATLARALREGLVAGRAHG
jgi:hypothetical protein